MNFVTPNLGRAEMIDHRSAIQKNLGRLEGQVGVVLKSSTKTNSKSCSWKGRILCNSMGWKLWCEGSGVVGRQQTKYESVECPGRQKPISF